MDSPWTVLNALICSEWFRHVRDLFQYLFVTRQQLCPLAAFSLICNTGFYRRVVGIASIFRLITNFAAYDCHLQMGTIAQGLLQMLAVMHAPLVWQLFGSWLRTISDGIPPSEGIVSLALRHCLPEFLAANSKSNILAKFIAKNLDLDRAEGWRLAS